jgi:transcriptional regulator GlxA family with amidase domain
MITTRLNVGILIFRGIEVLDFAGPYEVFSRTRLLRGAVSRRDDESAPFEVFTVAKTDELLATTGGLKVTPDYSFVTVPKIDLLVVPGGFGTRPLLEEPDTLDWIAKTCSSAQHVTSVCTGALILAKLDLLKNQHATTHWGALDSLADMDPTITVERNKRVVKTESGIFTSAGVSAGIDMAFDVVEMLHGKEVADDTAHYIEYDRRE